MTLVSTAVFTDDNGAVRYFEPRRERDMTLTQARKAASRFWTRRIREAGFALRRICLIERHGMVLTAHEKIDGRWISYTPPEDPPAYLDACLTLTGTPPPDRFLPPPILEINGYLYRLEI